MRQSTKRLFSMLFSFLLLVGAFVIFFNYTRATYEEIKNIRGEKFGLEKFLDTQRIAISKVRNLLNSYKNEIEFQKAISASFSDNPNLSEAVFQINDIANKSDLSLTSISISENKTGRKTSASTASLVKPINKILFGLKLVGSYENLKEFLSKLETNIRIFEINSINFRSFSEDVEDLYIFNIQIETYYQK